MKRHLLWMTVAGLVLIWPVGCTSKKEIAQLEGQIDRSRRDLLTANAKLAKKEAELAELHANIEALTAELVTVKVERDKLKQEVAELRRKQH